MTPLRRPTLRDALLAAGADAESLERAAETLRRADDAALPWYIRAATGFGAWVAACFFLGFLTLTGLFREQGVNFVFGAIILAVAVWLSTRGRGGEFVRQLALVLGLSGQGFVLASLEILKLEIVGLGLFGAALATALLVLHRDPVHRFLCAGGALTGLLVAAGKAEAAWLGEGLVVGALALVVALGGRPASRRAPPFNGLRVPVRFGLLATSLGVLAFSLGKELRAEWMSPVTSLGLTALLGAQMFRDMGALGAAPTRRLLLLPVLLVVGYISQAAPGVAAALIVLGMALRERDTLLLLFGVVFLAVFLGGFYYELALPLWHKAGVLVLSGAFAFGVRGVVLRLMPPEGEA